MPLVGIVEALSFEPEMCITGAIARRCELSSQLSDEIEGAGDDYAAVLSCSLCCTSKGIGSFLKRFGIDSEGKTCSLGHDFRIDRCGICGSRGVHLPDKAIERGNEIPDVSLTSGAKDEVPLDGREFAFERRSEAAEALYVVSAVENHKRSVIYDLETPGCRDRADGDSEGLRVELSTDEHLAGRDGGGKMIDLMSTVDREIQVIVTVEHAIDREMVATYGDRGRGD